MSVFYTLDQFRGTACVNVGFPDDSTQNVEFDIVHGAYNINFP